MNGFCLDRREMLRLCGASVASFPWRGFMNSTSSSVDHLLLGAADLDQGIAWAEKRLGVKAAIGGVHPGVGTRNALLSLGGRQYLEIIAPDPAQINYSFSVDVRKLAKPRLITWAAAPAGGRIDEVAALAKRAGCEVIGPRDGSRARPDGKLLKWKTMAVSNQLGAAGIELIPFFIEWTAESIHPSLDSPKGCRLLSLELDHPNAAGVREMLGKLKLDVPVKQSKEARLKALIDTPKGKLTLA
jgi:hypothetical protein